MSLKMQEKGGTLPTAASTTRSACRSSIKSRLIICAYLALILTVVHLGLKSARKPVITEQAFLHEDDLCPQVAPLSPHKHSELYEHVGNLVDTDDYKERAVKWLSGAVQIPTESFDLMGPIGEDPRWEIFSLFHEYLFDAFPLVHSALKLTKINTYGLVYHWQGSESELKPLLLAAHQDVVPVDPKTVDQWLHPPFSGHFDGTFIWGRGSSDDKSGLVSIMSTIETLLENEFQPRRSVVLAFGFDEETSGLFGAREIGNYLLEEYGENAFAFLVDEGGQWSESFGQIVATPAVGEKGYIDVRVEVSTPGGHSSIPPSHTSIGILASLLVTLEADPPVHHLGRTQPTYGTLQCLAAHAPGMPQALRKDILESITSDQALRRVEDYLTPRQSSFKALTGTTQAIDLIAGGVKTNALPEQAAAVVNHRIASDSSVNAIKRRVTKVLSPMATKFNLSLTAFGEQLTCSSKVTYGSLKLTDAFGTALEPAPITPTGPDAAPYHLLSGTIRKSLLESPLFRNTSKSIIVAPGAMTGNTRYYWKLTPHIFRYNHGGPNDTYAGGGVHTVNEAKSISGLLRQIRFFTTLILNSDESEL